MPALRPEARVRMGDFTIRDSSEKHCLVHASCQWRVTCVGRCLFAPLYDHDVHARQYLSKRYASGGGEESTAEASKRDSFDRRLTTRAVQVCGTIKLAFIRTCSLQPSLLMDAFIVNLQKNEVSPDWNGVLEIAKSALILNDQLGEKFFTSLPNSANIR